VAVVAVVMSRKIPVLLVVLAVDAVVARLRPAVREILLQLHHHKEVTAAAMVLEVH
jgi:hypothetical protein